MGVEKKDFLDSREGGSAWSWGWERIKIRKTRRTGQVRYLYAIVREISKLHGTSYGSLGLRC